MPPPSIKVLALRPPHEESQQASGSVFEPSQDADETSDKQSEVVPETQFEGLSQASGLIPDADDDSSFQPSSTNAS